VQTAKTANSSSDKATPGSQQKPGAVPRLSTSVAKKPAGISSRLLRLETAGSVIFL